MQSWGDKGREDRGRGDGEPGRRGDAETGGRRGDASGVTLGKDQVLDVAVVFSYETSCQGGIFILVQTPSNDAAPLDAGIRPNDGREWRSSLSCRRKPASRVLSIMKVFCPKLVILRWHDALKYFDLSLS